MVDNDFYELVNRGIKHSTDNWGTGVICHDTYTNKILLAKRTDNGLFASPGGKVEQGESPKEGILRECKEESNISIIDMVCYDFRTHSSPNGKNWVDFLFYTNKFDDSELKNQESEMEPFNWYTVEEALQLDLFPPTRSSLKRAIEMGLLDGTCPEENYIPFVECPTSSSMVEDSCCCAYSYQEPEKIFINNQGLYWD